MITLEEYLSELNSNVFYREFSFARNKFSPAPKSEFEFADNVVWLNDLLVAFQLKERNISHDTNPAKEEKWFNNKVIRTATKQIRDTLAYLKDYKEIHLTNGRNHVFNVATATLKTIDKIVLYSPHDKLPQQCRFKKHHRSSSAGLIHLFNFEDYKIICETLVTPTEIHHYLSYREELVELWNKECAEIPESALLGHFLYGDLTIQPSVKSNEYLKALKDNRQEWDYSNIGRIFADRITDTNNPKDYYKVITELARFNRSALKIFKERFDLALEKAIANDFTLPYRFVIPENGCGFVIIPITKDITEKRKQYLFNLTLGHKYDQKLNKCIGLSITPDSDVYYFVEWCFIEYPWVYDDEIEIKLKNNFPFRSVKEHYTPTYTFNNRENDN